MAALLRVELPQVGEADVVADAEADLGPEGRLEGEQLVAGAEGLALLEPDLPRDVDVEEVDLAELADQLALGRPHRRGVEELLALALRDGASDQVDLCHQTSIMHL